MTAATPTDISLAVAGEAGGGDGSSSGTVFYHGTDPESALSLANGTPLSLRASRMNQANAASVSGFDLAPDPEVAVYFASLHGRGVAILKYSLTAVALGGLLGAGAMLGPVPRGAVIGVLGGRQLVIHPARFRRFNALRCAGSIVVLPHRLGT